MKEAFIIIKGDRIASRYSADTAKAEIIYGALKEKGFAVTKVHRPNYKAFEEHILTSGGRTSILPKILKKFIMYGAWICRLTKKQRKLGKVDQITILTSPYGMKLAFILSMYKLFLSNLKVITIIEEAAWLDKKVSSLRRAKDFLAVLILGYSSNRIVTVSHALKDLVHDLIYFKKICVVVSNAITLDRRLTSKTPLVTNEICSANIIIAQSKHYTIELDIIVNVLTILERQISNAPHFNQRLKVTFIVDFTQSEQKEFYARLPLKYFEYSFRSHLSQSEYNSQMDRSHIALLPFPAYQKNYYRFPQKFSEYCMSGICVVTQSYGELRILTNNHADISVNATGDNPAELAELLSNLINDPSKITTVGDKARQYALRNFSASRQINTILYGN